MQNSKIEWCTHSFNPWHGCFKVSPGCAHCYAEVLSKRFGRDIWGPPATTPRRMMSENYWKQPIKWNEAAHKAGTRARVFCASMADVFEEHPDVVDARARLMNLIEETPDLDWLLLTKRPENITRLWSFGCPWDNVWFGTSVENQEQANKRVPHLLRVPAKVRFLSCEPLLGPLDLSHFLIDDWTRIGDDVHYHEHPALHWIIVGGESGHGARPMNPEWARSLRRQAKSAGASYFFKQWGEYISWSDLREIDARPSPTVYPWTTDPLDTRQDSTLMVKVGKHAAGRLLDGRTWDELPV